MENFSVVSNALKHLKLGTRYVGKNGFKLQSFLGKVLLSKYIVGSTDQESSQQLRTWFSKHLFAPKLVA